MSGVSNIRQVIANSPAVERVVDHQNRSDQAAQQHFVKHLQDKAADARETVHDVRDADAATVDEDGSRDDDDANEARTARSVEDRDEDEDGDEEHRLDVVA